MNKASGIDYVGTRILQTSLFTKDGSSNYKISIVELVFTIEEDTVTCQLPDDNSGILGMDAINMDESIIMSKLSKLNVNKSAGPDDIYPRILFEARAQLAHPLFMLFDTSLRVKKLPVDWCTANIVPIYKKGDKQLILDAKGVNDRVRCYDAVHVLTGTLQLY